MTALSSFASLHRPQLPPHDTIHAVVSLADSKAHGIVELSFGAPLPSRAAVDGQGLIITGTSGWINIYNFNKESERYIKVELYEEGKEKQEFEDKVQGVEREVENFVKLVAGKGDSGFGIPEGALSDVSFIEAALNSQGKLVQLI